MTFREKKELDALRSVVSLDVLNNVCQASYPEIDPNLEFKDNKWQAVAMSKSMEKHLNKTGMMEVYNEQFKDLLNRGCIEPVSNEEIEEWKNKGGKFSYISPSFLFCSDASPWIYSWPQHAICYPQTLGLDLSRDN